MDRLTRRTFLGGSSGLLPLAAARASASSARHDFQLAVTTDEIDDDLATALAFLTRHGLRHCEIRGIWGKYNTSQPMDRIREAKSMLDDAGIRLVILDTGFFKKPLPKASEALQAQWDLLDRAFERAQVLGTSLVRTFAFTYPKGGSPNAAAYPRIYELVAESAERAERAGFRLAVENVAGSYVEQARHSADLLAAVQSPALGLTWDPNNAARAGDAKPFPEGYDMLAADRIWHVHFRDYRRTQDGVEWCGVGDGEFDHVGQLRALARDGYAGSVSLETHYTIDGSKAAASERSVRGLKKAVERA